MTLAFADDGGVRRGTRTSEINYWFVGDQGEWDEEGRLLVWAGTISGDINGEMKWWFVMPSPVTGGPFVGGEVAYYSARWEIWDGEELLLAGGSAGKTVFPAGADGMWDGHGIVTEAGKGFNSLKGSKVYETGPVIIGPNPPFSYAGTGMFLIY
jgi:hypothetical protein